MKEIKRRYLLIIAVITILTFSFGIYKDIVPLMILAFLLAIINQILMLLYYYEQDTKDEPK